VLEHARHPEAVGIDAGGNQAFDGSDGMCPGTRERQLATALLLQPLPLVMQVFDLRRTVDD